MSDETAGVCCGEQPASPKGKPRNTVCILCHNSPTYWRDEPGAKERLAARAAAGDPVVSST